MATPSAFDVAQPDVMTINENASSGLAKRFIAKP